MDEIEDKESIARAHFPFRAEYCKTSRARCKRCQNLMMADTLKLAHMTKSRFHDGYDASYYHIDCFFATKRPGSVAEIRHFETLKYEDQKMLETAVETKGRSILAANDQNNNNGDNGSFNYDDFVVEYAKSARSKCNLCDQKIDKAVVRLGKLDFEAENPWASGPITRWFHVECFAKSLEQLEFFGQIDKLEDFDSLEDEDQQMLKKKIKVKKQKVKRAGDTKASSKRIKTEVVEVKVESRDKKEDLLLKEQSDRFFELHKLVSSMKRKDVEEMLKSMDQKYSYKASTILVDMATDVLLFGPLGKCPECKQTGGIQLRGSSYICTSSSEWAACTYETRSPKRSAPFVPSEITEKYSFFTDGTYEFIPGQRIFSKKLIDAMAQREAEVNKTVQEGAPLDGLTIGVLNYKSLKNEKTKVQKKVASLGGKLVTVLDRSCFAILASKDELKNEENAKAEVAKELNVPICTDDFLFKIETNEQVIPLLKKAIINKWKGDLEERFTRMNVNMLKQNIKSRAATSAAKSVYKSSRVPKSQTIIVKDGTVVDPDSNLAEVGRVYRRGPYVYSVVLNSIDVMQDKNSFYKMQIIEHETRKEYHLYRSWGRIGCEVGGNTCREMESLEDAVSTFEQLFEEKTGSPFSTVANGTFRKIHGRYFPIELDYSDPESKENEVKLEYSADSDLSKAVQELICFIFDVQRMHRAMKQFELDAEKMPLGKLSKNHITAAMETLKELERVLEVKPPKKPNKKQLATLTNKFFSYIPQSFGDGQVELINTLKQVDEKNQMLAGLQEIEIAYSMCTTVNKSGDSTPVDQYYIQLNCSIVALDKSNEMFLLVSEYVKKNHALTHSNYNLEVQEIFKIDREEDAKRFAQHANKERALLWHGSRTTNFAGILSQGLRVAPPEAPSTGFMFGKGIYFADMCSKAANYCMTDHDNPIGLLLLCEVALGKSHELFESDATLPSNLPKEFDSVKGVGKHTTDSKSHVKIEDGITVPIGKQVANKGVKSQLLYNEYVVYDESQTQLRYIVQTKFLFNR